MSSYYVRETSTSLIRKYVPPHARLIRIHRLRHLRIGNRIVKQMMSLTTYYFLARSNRR